MKTVLLTALWVVWGQWALAQPNCHIYPEGSDCRRACQFCEFAIKFPQGSRASQQLFDSAIALCPTLPYAWAEKSVPYLKRGDFVTWRILLDRAVALAPAEYLGYRAGCLFDFLRDYSNALADLEALEKVSSNGFLGYNANGDYDLRIVKALCERELGLQSRAVATFKACIADNEAADRVGLYDYMHYGATLLKEGLLEEAEAAFKKQLVKYEKFADTWYYLGCIYEMKQQKDLATQHFLRAYDLYTKTGYHRADPYCILPDQVFLSDIQAKL